MHNVDTGLKKSCRELARCPSPPPAIPWYHNWLHRDLSYQANLVNWLGPISTKALTSVMGINSAGNSHNKCWETGAVKCYYYITLAFLYLKLGNVLLYIIGRKIYECFLITTIVYWRHDKYWVTDTEMLERMYVFSSKTRWKSIIFAQIISYHMII